VSGAAFKRGQRVFFVRPWNRKGKFVVSVLSVHSCGAKRMVLVDDRGEKFAGCNFYPQRQQSNWYDTVETGMTLKQVVEFARQQAVLFKVQEIAGYWKRIGSWPEDPRYVAAMKKHIAEIEADEIGVEVRS
jgi:hypothetical protein